MPSSSGTNGCGMNYINHDISNPRLSLTFGGTNGTAGPTGTEAIPNTGGITLADIMLGYVYQLQLRPAGTVQPSGGLQPQLLFPGRLADPPQPHPEYGRPLQQ